MSGSRTATADGARRAEHAQTILSRAAEAVGRNGLDALVVISAANVRWVAGTSFLSQRALRTRPALVVITAGAAPIFILEQTEAAQARAESWLQDQRLYTQFLDDPAAVLTSVLKELGVARGKVGIEELSLSARMLADFRAALPEAEWVYAETLVECLRSIKTPYERDIMVAGALATDAAIADAFLGVRVGESEREIGDRMVDHARRHGGVFKHLVLGTGVNSFSIHHFPGEALVSPGDVLRTDFGMTWSDYASDLARTALVQPVSQPQLDVVMKLEDLHQSLLPELVSGARASSVFAATRRGAVARGLEFALSHSGHGIGLSSENVHESPVFQPRDHTELAPGMLVMLELLVRAGDGCYAVEDLVEITDAGGVIRSRSRDWSKPLVVG